MKYLFLTLSFAFASPYFLAFAQQLPTVEAKAVQSEKYYNWLISKPKRDEKAHNIWLVSGCKESVNNPTASSLLPSQPNENYTADNLADDDPTTAWIGGKNENIGEFVEFTAFPYSKWHLLNGHQKDKTTWENYARVKKMRIFIEGKPAFEVVLEDKMGAQTFELPENLKIDPDKIATDTKIKMVILSVYEGKKFKEVAISELFFAGC